MPQFKYKATRLGETYEGSIEVTDRFAVYKHIRGEHGTVISVRQVQKFSVFNFDRITLALNRVKTYEKITFAKNLATMVEAGLALSRALSVMERQTKNQKFKDVLVHINKDLNQGSSLHAALEKYPKIFSSLFTAMVRAGEESGKLVESLRVVGSQMESSYVLKKKIRGALIYPIIIIGVLVIVGILMLVYIVPTLSETFKELGVDLPASTRAIIAFSDFLKNNFFISIGILLTVVGGGVYWFRTKRGGRVFEFIILHMPIISGLVREINSARTARTLASLLSSGVGMVSAVSITRDVIQNSYYKEVLKRIGERIQKGSSMAEVLSEYEHLYPILMGEMIAVGEETGKLSDMLLEVAKCYEGEVSDKTKNMSTIVEPFLMVIVGVAVGFFAISMISPIYSLSSSI